MELMIDRLMKTIRSKKEIMEFCIKNKRKLTNGRKCLGKKESKMFWRMRSYVNPKHESYDYNFVTQYHKLNQGTTQNRDSFLKHKPKKNLTYSHNLFKNQRRGKDSVGSLFSSFDYVNDSVDMLYNKLIKIDKLATKENTRLVLEFIDKYGILPCNREASILLKREIVKDSDYYRKYNLAYNVLYRRFDKDIWNKVYTMLIKKMNTADNGRLRGQTGAGIHNMNQHIKKLGLDFEIMFS